MGLDITTPIKIYLFWYSTCLTVVILKTYILKLLKKFPSFHLTSGENDDTQKKTEKRIEISKVMML